MSLDTSNLFVWLMAAFFIVAGLAPLIAFAKTSKQYQGWGYPAWFPFVTAALEVLVGILLLSPETRVVGAVLGVLIMIAAIVTVLRNKEYAHAVPPTVVLVLTVLVGLI